MTAPDWPRLRFPQLLKLVIARVMAVIAIFGSYSTRPRNLKATFEPRC